MDIDILRYVSMGLWGIVAVLLLTSVIRTLTGRAQHADDWKAALFFVAMIMIGFIGRWVLFPEEDELYKLLYLMNSFLAVHVILLLRNRKKA